MDEYNDYYDVTLYGDTEAAQEWYDDIHYGFRRDRKRFCDDPLDEIGRDEKEE